jgi:hypothetical protein
MRATGCDLEPLERTTEEDVRHRVIAVFVEAMSHVHVSWTKLAEHGREVIDQRGRRQWCRRSGARLPPRGPGRRRTRTPAIGPEAPQLRGSSGASRASLAQAFYGPPTRPALDSVFGC